MLNIIRVVSFHCFSWADSVKCGCRGTVTWPDCVINDDAAVSPDGVEHLWLCLCLCPIRMFSSSKCQPVFKMNNWTPAQQQSLFELFMQMCAVISTVTLINSKTGFSHFVNLVDKGSNDPFVSLLCHVSSTALMNKCPAWLLLTVFKHSLSFLYFLSGNRGCQCSLLYLLLCICAAQPNVIFELYRILKTAVTLFKLQVSSKAYMKCLLLTFVFLWTGLHDTALFCSLHDPATTRPVGHITNKVRSH